ncbi:uncharacterized protein BP5553_00720 [Venustampulla echinocandica]|uniref:Nnf1-domain-containing protein n=1 Tax=Venustampulla echinocandica TaxID=2656787 RepID=A0A370TYY6_9HELO|nr:uncharacterized protein BP5553_00720 [Venustampulla echinocandica]RDL40741.1 hypothetical protein BP5553_00720 [Venustampulla echinocandica]
MEQLPTSHEPPAHPAHPAEATSNPNSNNTEALSPSPPPQPPTALTPGPRAQAFTTLYQKTLKATLSAIPYDAFAECFPHIAAEAPAALNAYHGQMVSRLRSLALDEFDTILQERNVVHHLNALEDIIADARRRQRSYPSPPPQQPPHTLPPEALLNAHLAPHLASQQSLLNAKLQTVESQNAALVQKIESQRREMEGLVGDLEAAVADLEGAGDLVGEEGEKLAGEGREVLGVLGS